MQESFVVVRKIDSWDNGYVAILLVHPFHGKSYDKINDYVVQLKKIKF